MPSASSANATSENAAGRSIAQVALTSSSACATSLSSDVIHAISLGNEGVAWIAATSMLPTTAVPAGSLPLIAVHALESAAAVPPASVEARITSAMRMFTIDPAYTRSGIGQE